MNRKLIVGLGNPGPRYRWSRHNVGFWCVEHLSDQWGITLSDRRSLARLGEGDVEGCPVVLAQPRTYMNHSGEGVSYLIDRFRASPADLMIIYDDMDLPVGRLRVRARGTAGGHNGLKSVIASLATQEFPRLRLGIGTPPPGQDDINFVLGVFHPDERQAVTEMIERAAEVVSCFVMEGVAQAMNRFNGM